MTATFPSSRDCTRSLVAPIRALLHFLRYGAHILYLRKWTVNPLFCIIRSDAEVVRSKLRARPRSRGAGRAVDAADRPGTPDRTPPVHRPRGQSPRDPLEPARRALAGPRGSGAGPKAPAPATRGIHGVRVDGAGASPGGGCARGGTLGHPVRPACGRGGRLATRVAALRAQVGVPTRGRRPREPNHRDAFRGARGGRRGASWKAQARE